MFREFKLHHCNLEHGMRERVYLVVVDEGRIDASAMMRKFDANVKDLSLF